MLLIASKIKESSIHGLGVFTAEPVKKGDLIWIFDPRCDFRLKEAPPSYLADYIFWDAEGAALDGDNSRFMNHSSTPNTIAAEAGLIAERNMAIGEEITVDYRSPHARCNMPWEKAEK